MMCNFVRVLASLNLPAALEDLSGDSIPQSIAEKARSIVEQGGLQSIEQLIKDLPELLTRNREILDEVSVGETHNHTAAPHFTAFCGPQSALRIKEVAFRTTSSNQRAFHMAWLS